MNEEKEITSKKKESTIDIFAPPKKSREVSSEPEVKKAPAPRRRATGSSEQTRFVSPSGKLPHTTTGQIAQKTRVGGTAVPPPSGAGGGKKGAGKKKDPSPKREANPENREEIKNSIRRTAITALVYIAIVVLISSVLSYLAIRWANDIFALVKEEVVATVTIPEDATLSEVADILEEKGLIRYSSVFRMYIGFKNRDADPPLSFKAGDYEIRSTLNYDQIVSLIKDRKTRRIVTITIPEGYSVDEIIDLFVSQDIGTREGFLYAVNEYPYQYTFMEALNKIEFSPHRKYRLEGYLFPNTYEFYTDSSEVAIVDKMLTAFESHFETAYYSRLEELNMNLDQVVTLASIVQEEGKFADDFYGISGVFHNRLNSKTLRKLQSDATIQYCLEEHKEELTAADLALENLYNTYYAEGLPPSAISNPGWEAIQAALYPKEQIEKNGSLVKCYFFISDTDGSTIYAENEPEHLKNVAALRAAKETGTTID